MPRRLLHVHQPVEAGVPRVVTALVADQVARGYDVHVASPAEPSYVSTTTRLGATHHDWAAGRSPGARVPAEAHRLGRLIEQIDPDVVVLHSAKAGLAGRLALRGSRPTVFVPHAWSFEAVGGPMARFAASWEVFAARWTHRIVCVSVDEQATGERTGIATTSVVVPNGVDVGALTPRAADAARQRLGLPNAPTVVCVGRLAEQKGQDLLLTAWPQVRDAVPDAQLVLVGDGPQRAALEDQASSSVRFVGAQTDPADYYAAADVVAVPSRWEGGPLVPLEAMAMGRPVVGFDVEGVRAAVGSTGTVVEPGDVHGLATALIDLLTDPVTAAAQGLAARARAEEVADLRTSQRGWNDVVTELAPSPQPQDGPPVSVVVTVLNEGAALGKLVEDLLPQLTEGDELLIVDGGSTDGSIEGLSEHPALWVEVVPGAGISAGRNHGIQLATNEVIVCTDAGCTPEPGFLDAFRRAFAGDDPPALVSGLYTAHARNAMERAQALACYPQPREVRRPTRFSRAYTKAFGTGFDPRFAVGRCVAFTRDAWKAAGGFPEHLATGEDVSFGLTVSRYGRCEAATDAVTDWVQRDGLAATWRMYRNYGRASTDGGNRALLARDGVRGLAYLAAPLLALHPAARVAVAVGGAAYLSLPVTRAVRAHAGPATLALLPVALATKDLGKLAGAVQGFWRARR